VKKIADAGLIIAALDRQDAHHAWAARLLQRESPPWLVCEPVLAETCASLGTPEPVRVSGTTLASQALAFGPGTGYSQNSN
jgi:predicted nucleic acid-binding protein